MITRDLSEKLSRAAEKWPAVTLTGPRQSGKTTLCRELFPQLAYVNLESPDTRAFAIEDSRGFLAQFSGGAILDEFQRAPDLLSYLQEIIDEDPLPGRWILTGSQNLALLKSASQSLAGRTAAFNLLPLARSEVQHFPKYPKTLDETLLMGSYPRVFDADLEPVDWYRSYVSNYV
ncbi:MAG: AAA family ATPase [Gammaproteobacteria bacterium]|nr:AAA family ATPase [Gammaproteobacteria bacterium]MCY4357717.1 AAA family ATPase [Gammaproteobacteria bacterium]